MHDRYSIYYQIKIFCSAVSLILVSSNLSEKLIVSYKQGHVIYINIRFSEASSVNLSIALSKMIVHTPLIK